MSSAPVTTGSTHSWGMEEWPPLALHGHVKAVGAGGEHPRAHAENGPWAECWSGAGRTLRPRRPARACGDDFHRAAGAFPRRAGNKAHPSPPRRAASWHTRHRVQQNGRVAAVPAGVHGAGMDGAVFQLVFLVDGQRVNVRRMATVRPGPAGAQHGHHAGGRGAGQGQPADLGQRVLQISGNLGLLPGELGVPVQPAPVLDQPVFGLQDPIVKLRS